MIQDLTGLTGIFMKKYYIFRAISFVQKVNGMGLCCINCYINIYVS